MTKIRERHNSVVNRLSQAVRSGVVRIDKQVPGIADECRPDIVIENDDDVIVGRRMSIQKMLRKRIPLHPSWNYIIFT